MDIPRKYKKFQLEEKVFPGFPSSPTNNYWRYPRIVNGWWHRMTGSEQKILDYILRHTWGYDKTSDTISFSQFQRGIYSKKERKWVDKGTGLERQAISEAIKGLEKKGFIVTEKRAGKTTTYLLRTKVV